MENMRFKNGDRVRIKSAAWYIDNKNNFGDIEFANGFIFTLAMSQYCGKILTIEHCFTDEKHNPFYVVKETLCHFIDEMIEGLAEDENGLPFNEWLSHKGAFTVPGGYELKDENGNVINATKIVLEKKKKEYPKTYEECCKVLGMTFDYPDIRMVSTEEFKLYSKFIQLKRCRDAYWKIAGDEMGLRKPWEPDYDSGVNKYGIICMNGVVQKSNPTTNWERHLNKVLDFPTEEMRDAFYENFTEEIEICKELL